MTTTWSAKDPSWDAIYRYPVALQDGDEITAGPVVTKLSGSVALGTQEPDETGVNVQLSGGDDGETSVFRVVWSTTTAPTLDDIVTIAVVENTPSALIYTGHAKPSPAHLLQRYPAFASVPPATIQYWLTDAEDMVDTSWPEANYATGLMMLAAHRMSLNGLPASGGASIPAGVTRFKSGAVDVTLSESAASARVKGGYAATPYGQEFQGLLRRLFGGPRLVGTLACGYPC